jgi:hypothetical protein
VKPDSLQHIYGRNACIFAVGLKLGDRIRHERNDVAFLQPASSAFMRLAGLSQASHTCDVNTAAEEIRLWMRSVIDGGLGAQEWASRAGVNKSTIFRALKPEYEFTTSSKTLEKLARAANTAPPELGRKPDSRVVPLYLPIRYKVQAGLWYEVDNHSHFELDDVGRQHSSWAPAVAPSPQYAEYPQWLELICGDSVNKKAPDGSFAHVVDAIELGYAPSDKDWVVVERRRAQGGLRERTVKQVQIVRGKMKLCPQSTNTKWQDPVEYLKGGGENEEGVEVEIVGKVIGFYLPA